MCSEANKPRPTNKGLNCGGCITTALPSIIEKKVNKNSENKGEHSNIIEEKNIKGDPVVQN